MKRGHWIALAVAMLISFMILAIQRDGLCLAAAVMCAVAVIKAAEATS